MFAKLPIENFRSPPPYHSTVYLSPASIEAGICEVVHPFRTQASISTPPKMGLQAEAERIAAEFELTDEQVQKTVLEFIREMSMSVAGKHRDPGLIVP